MLDLEELHKWPKRFRVGSLGRALGLIGLGLPAEKISAARADRLGAVIAGFRLAFSHRLSERDKTSPMRHLQRAIIPCYSRSPVQEAVHSCTELIGVPG
jgi:hypothetical protein